jgi:FkbM family methyltransferase
MARIGCSPVALWVACGRFRGCYLAIAGGRKMEMGSYTRSPFIEVLREHKFDIAFDVGSRNGKDALDVKKTYKPEIIYSFEPNPEAAEECRQNLAGKAGHEFHQVAHWHEKGRIKFYPAHYYVNRHGEKINAVGASSCFRFAKGSTNVTSEVEVETETLADFMARRHVPKIDLMCMDVQGAALNVLRGAGDRLADIHFIVTEAEIKPIYEGEALYDEIERFLTNAGFRLVVSLIGSLKHGDYLFENMRFQSDRAPPA